MRFRTLLAGSTLAASLWTSVYANDRVSDISEARIASELDVPNDAQPAGGTSKVPTQSPVQKSPEQKSAVQKPVVEPNIASSDCCTRAGCETDSEASEVLRLFPEICGVQAYGWANFGGTLNASKPRSRFNGPMTFNDRNEFQANQLYGVLEKKLNVEECCWDLGGRVDLLYGSDYLFTEAAGLETHRDFTRKWNAGPYYGLALPQAYGEIGVGNLSVKLGHFYTPIGYEVVNAPGNFFYSHVYSHQYGEPFTHTGGLATYKHSDSLSVYAGLVNGWDKFDTLDNEPAFLGGFTWTGCDNLHSLSFGAITGEENGAVLPVDGNRTMYSVVYKLDLQPFTWVVLHDAGWQDNFAGTGQTAEWYGLAQYLLYTINEEWKAGVRGEWFRDDDGTRVTGLRRRNPNAGPFVGNFWDITAGINWLPHSNVTIREEVRWDWFDGTGRPFDDGGKTSQFTLATDVIIQF